MTNRQTMHAQPRRRQVISYSASAQFNRRIASSDLASSHISYTIDGRAREINTPKSANMSGICTHTLAAGSMNLYRGSRSGMDRNIAVE